MFTPAYHCDRAVHTLLWDNTSLSWVLRRGGTVIGRLPGYPIGQPHNHGGLAVAWAAQQVPGREWIPKPPNSGAWHTH